MVNELAAEEGERNIFNLSNNGLQALARFCIQHR